MDDVLAVQVLERLGRLGAVVVLVVQLVRVEPGEHGVVVEARDALVRENEPKSVALFNARVCFYLPS